MDASRLCLIGCVAVGLGGCGAGVTTPDGGTEDLAAASADLAGDAGPAAAQTIRLTLDAGAFAPTAAHPSALVYIPNGFVSVRPLPVIVYIHGLNNCVDNIVRDAGASCDPGANTPARNASALAAQLEASGKNAILICPEVRFDEASGDPGNLGNVNGMRALLAELLPQLGPHAATVADLAPLVLFTHSGGYQAAAAIANRGGVPVSELHLLDSLYGNPADFDAWAQADLPALATTPPQRRFSSVYTSGGGTLANSQAMAGRAGGWVAPEVIVDDRTTATWPDATYLHGLLFKLTGLSHADVPRYYFGKMVETSGLPAK